MQKHLGHYHKITGAGVLISLGIIFGDIGTSPLYVLKAIAGAEVITEELIFGGLSCIFWTLTLQTTLKYVVITLNADNNGEGGIFSLFALIRRRYPKLIIPAIIGGSALLADSLITPPISVSSAIEGLRILRPDIPTVPIVIGIITFLFIIQSFGTGIVGRTFGPMMFVWFMMLLVLGVSQIWNFPHVLQAVNPYYAYKLLAAHPEGFWFLGAVFLCTTGAEALYSDLGHCGKGNIRISWGFVKTALLANYFGQGAWLLTLQGEYLGDRNPFYSIMPSWFLLPGIVIATIATVIASQALISGSFTLVSEAMRLNLWPKVKVSYPTEAKGQMYVPGINRLLLAGCIGVVLLFRESSNMEGAYGLSITLTMLMTSVLLCFYLFLHKIPIFLILLYVLVYFSIEGSFLVANLSKFMHGGWVTLVLASLLILIMWTWFQATKIKSKLTEFTDVKPYLSLLTELSNDETVPKYATNLVYLTAGGLKEKIETKIIYSIINKRPKRADIYWFIHVDVTDEPYRTDYSVDILVPNKIIRVNFKLGFRIEQRINYLFRKVVEELSIKKEIDIFSRFDSLRKHNIPGDFRFVVSERYLSYENELSAYKEGILNIYYILKKFSLSEEKAFGLDTSSVTVEAVPLVLASPKSIRLRRVFEEHE